MNARTKIKVLNYVEKALSEQTTLYYGCQTPGKAIREPQDNRQVCTNSHSGRFQGEGPRAQVPLQLRQHTLQKGSKHKGVAAAYATREYQDNAGHLRTYP